MWYKQGTQAPASTGAGAGTEKGSTGECGGALVIFRAQGSSRCEEGYLLPWCGLCAVGQAFSTPVHPGQDCSSLYRKRLVQVLTVSMATRGTAVRLHAVACFSVELYCRRACCIGGGHGAEWAGTPGGPQSGPPPHN